jgi:hypothetical protein
MASRLRSTPGVGSGYQFLEFARTNPPLEGGLTYVTTDHDIGVEEDHPAGRWALNFDHFVFETRTQLFHDHEAYVGLEDRENMFVRSQTGLRFPLVRNLNATARYNVDRDNQPAPGRVKADKTRLLAPRYGWQGIRPGLTIPPHSSVPGTRSRYTGMYMAGARVAGTRLDPCRAIAGMG